MLESFSKVPPDLAERACWSWRRLTSEGVNIWPATGVLLGGGAMTRISDDYTAFFRAEYERVVRTVELVVGDHETALDIAQDAFARLYPRWNRVARYDQPDAFVRRIAMNLAISCLRRRNVQAKALGKLLPSPTETEIADDSVLSAVRRLPPAQRAAVVLFYFEDQPVSEVARIMDCSESTARVHLHKARTKLAKQLPYGTDERSAHVAR